MSLIAHYRLDGNADDALGQLNGVASGGVSWVDGKLGQGGEFNGVNGTIYLGTGADLFPLSSFSVSVWFKSFGTTPDTGTSPGILGLTYGIRLFVYPDLIQFGLDDGSTFTHLNSPASYDFYNDNLWHHVVISTTPTTMHLFIDGAEVASKAVDWKGTTRWPTNSLIIGKDNNNYPYHFTGLLDDVRIYDHALSKHEVKDLAKGLAVNHKFNNDLYDAARYISGTPVGDVGFTTVEGRNCAVFSSAGKRMDIEPFYAPKATLAFWYKRDDTIAAANWRTVLGCSANIHPAIFQSGSYVFGLFDGSFRSSGFTSPSDGKIHHYATAIHGDGTASFYVDGQHKTTVSTTLNLVTNPINKIGDWNGGYWAGVVGEVQLYANDLTADDIKELYQRRASLDAQGNFYAGLINDTGIKQPLLLDYTQWQDGQTGSVGMFNYYAVEADCKRLFADNPWGKQTIVWHTQSSGGSSGNGGYYTDRVSVDASKLHRVSVWMRRVSPGNGRGYSGILTDIMPLRRGTGAADGNPYFWYSNVGFAGMPANEWVLVVGHVWPEGSPTGANHPDSGIYTAEGVRIANIHADFIFGPEAQSLAAGAFLHYATDVTTVQQLCYPRMDVCDGTEPSIAELLAGFDSRNESLFRAKSGALPGQSIAASASGVYSEVGITYGLVAYYPLTKDAKDYSGNGYDGVVNGAVPVGGGFDGKGAFSFDNTGNQWVNIDSNFTSFSEISFSAWVKPEGNHKNYTGTIISSGNWNNAHWAFGLSYDNSAIQTRNPLQSVPYSFTLNEWHHVAWAFKSGYHYLFVNGVLIWSGATSVTNLTSGYTNTKIASDTYMTPGYFAFNGEICNVKIFNRALSPEEIAVEYKRTGPAKMTQYAGRTYIQGQFKEVTA